MYNKKKLPKYQDNNPFSSQFSFGENFLNTEQRPNFGNIDMMSYQSGISPVINPLQKPEPLITNPQGFNTFTPDQTLGASRAISTMSEDPFDNTIPEGNMYNETKERQPFFPNMYQDPYSANEYMFNAGALGATARGIKQGDIDAGKGYGKLAGVGAGLSVLGGVASGVKSALQGAGAQKSFTQAEQERQENLRRYQTQNFTDEQGAFTENNMRTNNNVRGLDGGMFKNNPFSMQEGGAIESVIANDITAEPTNPNTNVEVEKGEVVIDPNTNDVRLVQGQTHQQTDEYKGQEYSGVPTEFQGGEMVIPSCCCSLNTIEVPSP